MAKKSLSRDEYLDSKSWSDTGKWATVRSRRVAGIRYRKSARRLFVEYKDGSVRAYERVHPMTARAMFNTLKVDEYLAKRVALRHMTSRLR